MVMGIENWLIILYQAFALYSQFIVLFLDKCKQKYSLYTPMALLLKRGDREQPDMQSSREGRGRDVEKRSHRETDQDKVYCSYSLSMHKCEKQNSEKPNDVLNTRNTKNELTF